MNEVVAVSHDYGSFLQRFIARVIDTVLVSIPVALLGTRLSYAAFLIYLLYFPVFEGSVLQATPGKRIMGLIVTDENGQRLTIKKSVVRFFVSLVSGFISFGIGYLIYFFTARKQTLHDLAAETLVLKGKKDGALADAWLSQLKLWFK